MHKTNKILNLMRPLFFRIRLAFEGYLSKRGIIPICLFLIRIYRKCISPALGTRCRFYPSCSEYSSEVIKKYGLAHGLKKSVIRICKCQPFCKGGIDLP